MKDGSHVMGLDIRLVFTLPPKYSKMQYKDADTSEITFLEVAYAKSGTANHKPGKSGTANHKPGKFGTANHKPGKFETLRANH